MVIQNKVTINANTQTDDVLVNQLLAVSQGFFLVDYALVGSAIGLVLDLKVGLRDVAPQYVPNINNRFPIVPDDFVGKFGIIPGDRIILRARNTTGGNLDLFYCFRFTPVGR